LTNKKLKMLVKKKKYLLLMLIVVTIIHFVPFKTGKGPSSYITIKPGITFKSIKGGGPITFPNQITTTKVYWSSNLIRFDAINGTSGNTIGFYCPSTGSLEAQQITRTKVQLNVTTSSPSNFRIHVGTRGSPSDVSGADSWGYQSSVATMTINSDSIILMSWSEDVPTTIDDLITQYLPLGDMSGFIIANYTQVLGIGFFAIVFLVPVIGIYMKGGMIAALLAILMLWGIMQGVIPSAGLQLGMIFLVVGIGLYMAHTIMSRRD